MMMVDPTPTQLINGALAAPDPAMWPSEHDARAGAELLRAAREGLGEALRSDTRQAPTLGDLGIAATTVVDDPVLLDLFTRLCEDLHRAGPAPGAGDFTHSQAAFE